MVDFRELTEIPMYRPFGDMAMSFCEICCVDGMESVVRCGMTCAEVAKVAMCTCFSPSIASLLVSLFATIEVSGPSEAYVIGWKEVR